MADIIAAAWARVGRPSLFGYDFICHCGVCSALRSKTKDPREDQVKVYIVTQGDYSDYGIHGVFIDRAAAEAFVAIDGGDVEEWNGYSELPDRERWYVIEKMNHAEVFRSTSLYWPWDGPQYVGQKRKSWNYSKWQYGERAWGMDEQAVEKAWTEQHMAEEALEAGL